MVFRSMRQISVETKGAESRPTDSRGESFQVFESIELGLPLHLKDQSKSNPGDAVKSQRRCGRAATFQLFEVNVPMRSVRDQRVVCCGFWATELADMSCNCQCD